MNDFVSWLITEMNSRGWSNSELAKRADVVPSTVSLVVTGKSNPGDDLCLGISRAFRITPEEVFRRAGILPPLLASDNDQAITRVLEYMRRLGPNDRNEILLYTMFRYAQSLAAIEQKSEK